MDFKRPTSPFPPPQQNVETWVVIIIEWVIFRVPPAGVGVVYQWDLGDEVQRLAIGHFLLLLLMMVYVLHRKHAICVGLVIHKPIRLVGQKPICYSPGGHFSASLQHGLIRQPRLRHRYETHRKQGAYIYTPWLLCTRLRQFCTCSKFMSVRMRTTMCVL